MNQEPLCPSATTIFQGWPYLVAHMPSKVNEHIWVESERGL